MNVEKCKRLDAWRPKWEAKFYMGQRQEDYRTEINGGEKEGEILMRIVYQWTHRATCIMVTVASRGNAEGPLSLALHPRVF